MSFVPVTVIVSVPLSLASFEEDYLGQTVEMVAAQAEGLLPISQTAMAVVNRLSYHDYEGIATDLEERERLVVHGLEAELEAAGELAPAQLGQAVKVDFDRNAAIVKQFNIQLNQ